MVYSVSIGSCLPFEIRLRLSKSEKSVIVVTLGCEIEVVTRGFFHDFVELRCCPSAGTNWTLVDRSGPSTGCINVTLPAEPVIVYGALYHWVLNNLVENLIQTNSTLLMYSFIRLW